MPRTSPWLEVLQLCDLGHITLSLKHIHEMGEEPFPSVLGVSKATPGLVVFWEDSQTSVNDHVMAMVYYSKRTQCRVNKVPDECIEVQGRPGSACKNLPLVTAHRMHLIPLAASVTMREKGCLLGKLIRNSLARVFIQGCLH